MADDSQDKFNEPGYKKDVERIKKLFSTDNTRPGMRKTNMSYTSPTSTTKSDSTTSEDNTRPGMRKANMTTDYSLSSNASSGAGKTSSESSFGKAFSEARKAGNKDFDYQGKKYAAVTKEEVDKSGSKNLTEYLNKNKSTLVADKGKTEPDDYSQLDTSVQRTATSTGKTEPDDYSQLDTSVQKTSTADSSDIFSSVKKLIGLRKGGMSDDMSMERARGVTPEQFAEEHKTPHSKNKYKDGGDIHVTKGHDYIKDLL